MVFSFVITIRFWITHFFLWYLKKESVRESKRHIFKFIQPIFNAFNMFSSSISTFDYITMYVVLCTIERLLSIHTKFCLYENSQVFKFFWRFFVELERIYTHTHTQNSSIQKLYSIDFLSISMILKLHHSLNFVYYLSFSISLWKCLINQKLVTIFIYTSR